MGDGARTVRVDSDAEGMRVTTEVEELRERLEDLDDSAYEYGCPCTGMKDEPTLCFIHGRDKVFAFCRDLIDRIEALKVETLN